ncbi:TetR family transcriptional regulator [Nocardioides sp.]|uniref:TetR/AcrR family transcriptional regulator n=1 Tax=Nocardioides sp. TaxID=35761 RepID=UPI0035297158
MSASPTPSRGAKRGRRPGAPDTRAAILDSARELFASGGFAGTSVRAVAAGAGVDPALVHHYFGSKDDLFVAALELPVDPRVIVAPALAEGPDGAGERMLRVILGVWDNDEHRLPLLAMARSILEPSGEQLIGRGFLPVVIEPLGEMLGIDHPDIRMPLFASQIVGLIMLRYLLEAEPLASMPVDDVVAAYAPTLQRYLTGDLGFLD